MCTSYAKESSQWVCEEAQSQRDLAMLAWGQAFEKPDSPDSQVEPPDNIHTPEPRQTQSAVCSPAEPAPVLPRPVVTQ